MAPRLIFGTASFGMDMTAYQDAESVESLLRTLQAKGILHLDTGARYSPLNSGRSEELIGEASQVSSHFTVDTKVYTDIRTDGSGDLTSEAVEKSISNSLQRLRRPNGVNTLYTHRADPVTPLEEQILAFNAQIEQGKCKQWGVSNTPPDVLERILKLCNENGWKKPSCYQGEYSIISRGAETQLFPILRAHGLKFNAFRGLASGFLTGKFVNNQHQGTRLGDDNPLGKRLQTVFGSEELGLAMRRFETAVKAHDVSPVEVAVRWLAHNSALEEGDGIVIGASRPSQLVELLDHIQKGPLSAALLGEVDEFWNQLRSTRDKIL